MNKIYFFKTHEEAETGVFISAQNWKEARKIAIDSETFMDDDYKFIEIVGGLHKEKGRMFYTEKRGELDQHDLINAGCVGFHWVDSDCEQCGIIRWRIQPVNGKMICGYCEDELIAQQIREREGSH